MMRLRTLLFLALFAAAAPSVAAAQATPVAIDPGMSRDSVVARFGKPASEQRYGNFTYLFFGNGREAQVGMADIVILENGVVVDAVLRSPRRTYTGTSSSPRAISASEAARAKQSPPPPNSPSTQ
jgi:outer membrane protein assembly factor BamE (lipoprotein component of BamABCDE complex)